MNTRLLLASLIGVGSIGGAVAGGYYLSQETKTQETVSNKQPNTTTDGQTTNEISNTSTQATQTPLTKAKPTVPVTPKEPAPTAPKEPGTSENEVGAGRTGDIVGAQLGAGG